MQQNPVLETNKLVDLKETFSLGRKGRGGMMSVEHSDQQQPEPFILLHPLAYIQDLQSQGVSLQT